MKKLNSLVSAALATLLLAGLNTFSFAQEKLPAGLENQLAKIRSAIKEKGAKWEAGETSLSRMSEEEWQFRVGLNFQTISAAPIEEDPKAVVPAGMDWRDNEGNFVTGVRNQGQCGSCWSFAMAGALESNVIIAQKTPGTDLFLSEQVFISCGDTGSCKGGTLNASFLKSTGLPPASYYPYTGTDGTCSAAKPGWEGAAYRIGSWGSVSRKLASLKTALNKYGPLPTALMVYEDFMHYKTGVYSYTTGKKLGGHAVLLVGYNDDGQYFIVKNSWGPNWGENGFFRIAYSEMNTLSSFGLSTIAYTTPASTYPAVPTNGKMADTDGTFNHETTMERIEPILQPARQAVPQK